MVPMGMTRARRVTRWVLEALLAAVILGTLALAGLAHVVPASGHPVLIIRSGSMAPTIPVGAAVVLDAAPAGDIQVGDVVTMRLDNGAIFSHRVTRLVSVGGVPYIETKGDANATVDPSLTPVSHVMGRVALTLPLVGFLMAGLAMPAGLATVLLAALTLFTALWLLDEDEAAISEPEPAPAVAPRRRRVRLLPWVS
jgi:signal peptidase